MVVLWVVYVIDLTVVHGLVILFINSGLVVNNSSLVVLLIISDIIALVTV